MKHNQLPVQVDAIPKEALENLFNVYKTTSGDYFYNIMRTAQMHGMDNFDQRFFIGHDYREGEQWASISYRYYGTVSLWWIVAKINGFIDPFQLPTGGTRLAILRKDQVDRILKLLEGG